MIPGPSTGSHPEPFRVLVVDDEPDQLELLVTLLRRSGCDVIGATTGEQALQRAAAVTPELAVIDLRLPGIDGLVVADALRLMHPGCRIALTSVADIEDFPPADAHLPKPFTRQQVLALLTGLRTPVRQ